jgi:ABC-2 type transport system ATP-binding protein
VLRRLDSHGIAAITCQPPTLEELFLSQYRDEVTTADEAPKEEVRA